MLRQADRTFETPLHRQTVRRCSTSTQVATGTREYPLFNQVGGHDAADSDDTSVWISPSLSWMSRHSLVYPIGE